jgi:hypothetical protein
MTDVAPHDTYPGSLRAWALTRFAALVQALTWMGVPFARALKVARAILALWAQETRYGQREDNYNAANMHVGSGVPDAGPGWHGARVRRLDGGAFAWFRAYDSLRDAAIDSIEFLRSPRYRAAWDDLVRDPDRAAHWYAAILQPPDGGDGYHPYSAESVSDYARIFEGMPRRFAAAPPEG